MTSEELYQTEWWNDAVAFGRYVWGLNDEEIEKLKNNLQQYEQ